MDEAKKLEIKLFKQTYREFASQGLEEILEPIGIVVSVFFDQQDDDGKYEPIATIENLNRNLVQKAEAMGATHVFGIEYSINDSNYAYIERMATGDAYKPKENKNGPYR